MSQTTAHPPRRIVWRLGCIATAAAALGLAWWGFVRPALHDPAGAWLETRIFVTGEDARARIETTIGAPLPSTARDLVFASYRLFPGDSTAWLRFALAPTAFDDLSAASSVPCLDTPLTTGRDPGGLREPDHYPADASASDWNPAGSQAYRGATCNSPNAVYALLVDATDPARWIVYLEITEI